MHARFARLSSATAAIAVTTVVFGSPVAQAADGDAEFLSTLAGLGIEFATPDEAALVVLRCAALILAAGLVTLTTRTADLVAVIERGLSPLSRLGLDVVKVSLAISLTIRFIPTIGQIAADVREAQVARGRRPSPLTLVVPVIIRLLKMADEIAEAIDARS